MTATLARPSTPSPAASAPSEEAIETALGRGLELLEQRQYGHGEIATYRFRNPQLNGAPSFESSPYGTTYVLYSLERVLESWKPRREGLQLGSRIADLSSRALGFLAEEMEPPGLWRYYSSRNAKSLAPDLDDTACASYALRRVHDVVRLGLNLRLFLANRDSEGFFRTFLSEGRNNVDAVVNANVLFYLGEREETRAACRFLVRVAREGADEEASLYGLDELSLAYVVSRAYASGVSGLEEAGEPLVRRTLERRREDGSFGSPFDTALAVNTLLNFGQRDPEVLAPAVRSLLELQRAEDGAWQRAAFYIDFFGGFYGSEELTTALCMEALARAGEILAGEAGG